MKLYTFILVFLFGTIAPTEAQKIDQDSMYSVLDNAIVHSTEHLQKRIQRIHLLESQLKNSSNIKLSYFLCYKLFQEYTPYIHERACFYLSQCINLAEKMKDKQDADICRLRLAIYYIGAGFYEEALYFIRQTDTTHLSPEGKGLYLRAYYQLYNELSYYTPNHVLKVLYDTEKTKYEKAMMTYLSRTEDMYFETHELELMSKKQNLQNLRLNTQWLHQVKKGSHRYALVTLFRYLSYKALRDTTKMMYWITESAITDARDGVMDQGSMWELANQLMLQGHVERAYRYISYLSNCSNKFGSRQRSWQITPLLANLANKYKQESEQNGHRLIISFSALSILFLFALLLLGYTIKQRNRLSDARNMLSGSNQKLYSFNQQLKQLNIQLEQSNSHLADSNRVKEEYIGRFLELCSLYIDKIDRIRKRTNRYIKNKQYEELYQATKDNSLFSNNIDILYKSFDTAFIHLFPHFIEDFNALLKPEVRIETPKDGHLNTTIRIFALIRLGITGSSKIAEFLHYSVNTIYNYRARTKNGAIGNREEFEDQIKEIGLK